jgi:hypothetical protein
VKARYTFPASSRSPGEVAAPHAGLEWLISLSDRCKSNKEKRGTERDRGYESVVDDETTAWLFDLSRDRIREAATNGTLIRRDDIISLLYRWRDRSTAEEVRAWTDVQLDDDQFVVAIAKDAIQESWSYGMDGFGSLGDRVSHRSEYVHLKSLSVIVDVERFKTRVSSLHVQGATNEADRATLAHFAATPERDPERFD